MSLLNLTKMQKPITKQELAQKLGVSLTYLRKYMNNYYYKELFAVGYRKSENFIPPIVYKKFAELYGIDETPNND